MNPVALYDKLTATYGVATMPPAKRQMAELIIANCLRDLTWWPGLARDIIQDVQTALAKLRDTEDVLP